jgi:hypothetical protein
MRVCDPGLAKYGELQTVLWEAPPCSVECSAIRLTVNIRISPKCAPFESMSQMPSTMQTGDAVISQTRNTTMLYNFRNKLAQRMTSNSSSASGPKPYDGHRTSIQEASKPVDANPPTPKAPTAKTTGQAPSHAERVDSRYNSLIGHLRCTECHKLGQLVGEARLGGITLAQRQNDTIYALRMLIKDASAALEAIVDSQRQLGRSHKNLDESLDDLTANCPGCIILSSGITRPVETADLTDETRLRQSLARMATTTGMLSESTTSVAVGPETLSTVEGWVDKLKQAGQCEDSQRSQAQNQVSDLQDIIAKRRAPFESEVEQPRSKQPDFGSSGYSSTGSPTSGSEKLVRSQSVDLERLRQAKEGRESRVKRTDPAGFDEMRASAEGKNTSVHEKEGKDNSLQPLPVKETSDYREPPPNWPPMFAGR